MNESTSTFGVLFLAAFNGSINDDDGDGDDDKDDNQNKNRCS